MIVTNQRHCREEQRRSAIVSPNVAPNTGLSPARSSLRSRGEKRSRKAESWPTRRAGRSSMRKFPGSRSVLQAPGRSRRKRLCQWLHRRLSSSSSNGENLEVLSQDAEATRHRRRRAARCPGVRDVRQSVQLDYPELHGSTPSARKSGFVGRSTRAPQRRPRSTRRLGNINAPEHLDRCRSNGQSYYVVTSYDRERRSPRHRAISRTLPVRFDDGQVAPCSSARTAPSGAPLGRGHRGRAQSRIQRAIAHLDAGRSDVDIGSRRPPISRSSSRRKDSAHDEQHHVTSSPVRWS